MCRKIVINRGEKHIETPLQFKKHFGFYPEMNSRLEQIDLVSCLCPVFIHQTFKAHNIEYKMLSGDYYVGQLESVIEK